MTETTPRPAASDPAAANETPFRYTAGFADAIETRWQAFWADHDTFCAPNPGEDGFDAAKPKFYCLDMFPYPSGAGLHVGHPEGYTATDIVCRYKRHRGFNVLHPMGWDAFGLPAEQYAIQTGVHPAITTFAAINNFRRQLQRFGFCYDWSREFATIDPDYYRWTQWIWLRAYDAWCDARTQTARPIADLVADLESGALVVDREGTPVPADGARDDSRAWRTLDADARRDVVDGQRLAYVGEQTVNWCPQLGTALANEEVIDGRSERGGFPVLRRPLRQWMFRITAFADRLLADLDDVDWPESTRTQQREWIGRSEGAEIDFPIADVPDGAAFGAGTIRVYTTRPDTIFGATYMVLAPEHPLVAAMLDAPRPGTDVERVAAYVETARNRGDVERMAESKEKTGVATGYDAVNPATGARIPIWIADYVLMGYGHGAIMAVPGHDERDFAFARRFDLPVVAVVMPDDAWLEAHVDGAAADRAARYAADPGVADEAFAGTGRAVNSANDEVALDGRDTPAAKDEVIAWLERRDLGRRRVNFKLRDWLFSRQRYWGEPFPIVYDADGHHHAVDAAHLPVALPEMEDYQPIVSDDPVPLLAKATDWVDTTAGAAGAVGLPADAPVRRETNTMPGWAGSCWYYLRYCDPKNQERFVGRDAEAYWMADGGVDLYIGGAEHAVLHLLYARFWHKILHDLGEVSTPEPFSRLFHQGLITSFAYQRDDGSLVAVDAVDERDDGTCVERTTGDAVRQVTAKMSKSLKNVVNPDDIIAEYGADAFRLYEMYLGPLEAMKPWNTRDIVGVFRFLQRTWRLVVDERTGALTVRDDGDPDVERLLHRTIRKVGEDIERLAFNTAIAAMIEFVNVALKSDGLTRDQLGRFAVLLSPFAPHLAEELWSKLGHDASIADAAWPAWDEAMLVESELELPVQIQGKVRAKIVVPADADAAAVEATALADPRVQDVIAGRPVRKVIVVPGRIVNVIV